MEGLGFVTGGNVVVVSNISGNIIVKIKESRREKWTEDTNRPSQEEVTQL